MFDEHKKTCRKMKHLIITFCLFCSLVASAQKSTPVKHPVIPNQTDSKAKLILDKASDKIKQQAMKINFSLLIEDTKTSKKETIKGDVIMKGQKFRLAVPMSQTYYNGKDQYIYVPKNNEVSISTPTKKELQEVNPAYLLMSYASDATVQFSKDNAASNSFYTIDVFPDHKMRKEYFKAIVKIDKKTLNLKSIKVLNKNGVHSSFFVEKIERRAYEDAFFTFYSKSHPNVIVNDLR